MQEKTKKRGFRDFIRITGKRFVNLGRGLHFMDRETVAKNIKAAKENKVAELVNTMQDNILGEIRFRVHQPINSITDFEKNNLVVSLTETEQTHSREIFQPFIEKGYTVVPLSDYEPFGGYNVYLVSWK